jgi:hypothetical protein
MLSLSQEPTVRSRQFPTLRLPHSERLLVVDSGRAAFG